MGNENVITYIGNGVLLTPERGMPHQCTFMMLHVYGCICLAFNEEELVVLEMPDDGKRKQFQQEFMKETYQPQIMQLNLHFIIAL